MTLSNDLSAIRARLLADYKAHKDFDEFHLPGDDPRYSKLYSIDTVLELLDRWEKLNVKKEV